MESALPGTGRALHFYTLARNLSCRGVWELEAAPALEKAHPPDKTRGLKKESLVHRRWLSADGVRRYKKVSTLSRLVAKLPNVVSANVYVGDFANTHMLVSLWDDSDDSRHRERATAPYTKMSARSSLAATKEYNAIVLFDAGWLVAKELQKIEVQVSFCRTDRVTWLVVCVMLRAWSFLK